MIHTSHLIGLLGLVCSYFAFAISKGDDADVGPMTVLVTNQRTSGIPLATTLKVGGGQEMKGDEKKGEGRRNKGGDKGAGDEWRRGGTDEERRRRGGEDNGGEGEQTKGRDK